MVLGQRDQGYLATRVGHLLNGYGSGLKRRRVSWPRAPEWKQARRKWSVSNGGSEKRYKRTGTAGLFDTDVRTDNRHPPNL